MSSEGYGGHGNLGLGDRAHRSAPAAVVLPEPARHAMGLGFKSHGYMRPMCRRSKMRARNLSEKTPLEPFSVGNLALGQGMWLALETWQTLIHVLDSGTSGLSKSSGHLGPRAGLL